MDKKQSLSVHRPEIINHKKTAKRNEANLSAVFGSSLSGEKAIRI